jgi:hypothetical protein
MKANFTFLMVLAVLLFASCKKNEATVKPAASTTYSDANGTFVVLNTAHWYTTTSVASGSSVFLTIAGYTNAGEVTLSSVGDGVQTEYPITMYQPDFFNTNVGISFTESGEAAIPTIFQSSTVLKAYRGNDTLKVTLKSGNLQYQ